MVITIGWGITSRCNMTCGYCYSKETRSLCADVSLTECKAFIDDNYQHIAAINYGTGENTLIDHWFELVEYVRKKYSHIRMALTTNGYLAESVKNDEYAEIVRSSIDEVDVSLDFGNRKLQNSIRKCSQSYDWVMETLSFCRSCGIPVTIVVVGLEDTLHLDNMAEIFEIAEAFGAMVRLNIYRPVIECGYEPPKLDTVIRFLDWVHEYHDICAISDPLFSAAFLGQKRVDPSGSCSFRVLPDGSICISTYLLTDAYRVGRITDPQALQRVAQTPLVLTTVNRTPPEECIECRLLNHCQGGAIDRRFLSYGTTSVRDPYCPKRWGFNDLPLRHYRLSGQDAVSIHDSYLPTMIFRPKTRQPAV